MERSERQQKAEEMKKGNKKEPSLWLHSVFLTHHKALQDAQLAMQSSVVTKGGNPTQNVGARKS